MAGRGKRKIRVRLASELGARWAARANLVEEKGADLALRGDSFILEIGPFETATVALGF